MRGRRYASLPVTEEPPKQSAAATAAEKVRAIVEAAERSAAELEAAAREDAVRIRAEAERDVESLVGRARELAARVGEHAAELERQVAAIRASLGSFSKELEELRKEPVAPPVAREAEPVANVASGEDPDDIDETIAEAEVTAARGPEVAEADVPPGDADAAATHGSGEGARLIALNMALRGAPRHETARYLAENFELDDPDALLDDVYARAGG
jgi:vacuolar-type H+-ATPase subunit E/Vma4